MSLHRFVPTARKPTETPAQHQQRRQREYAEWQAQRAVRKAELAAERAAKAGEPKWHCQICGREIKAGSGRIAHHGYQRPGHGWQTASCMGHGFRPYEVACDALPPAIASVTAHIALVKKSLATLMENPPAVLTYQRRDAYGRPDGALRTFPKPEGFDPAAAVARGSYTPNTYEWRYAMLHGEDARNLKHSQATLKYFKDRLAAWVAP